MSFARAYNPTLHFEDDNGHPLAGGWLYTYLAGTNIPVATAANESGSSMNPVQIHLDSRGECEAWLSNSLKYKFVVYNSDRTWSQTKDNVSVGVCGGEEYSGDVSDATATFSKDDGDTSEISSGSKLNVLFTKISKFFAGLKALAFKDKADLTQDVSGILPITNGGTGGVNAGEARTNLDVYSKSETDTLLNGKIVITQTLPASGEAGKIYYVGPSGSGADQYEEYIWDSTNSTWIKTGERSLDLSNYLQKNGDGKDVTVTFTEASTRTNIASTESLSTLFGKVKKFFTDLASVAFSGNYNDLSNKPSIPDVSGKLNINGDNATAAGSRTIVDKLSYNDDPTIDDSSNILHKNGIGNWEKISLSGIWEYIKSKFVPVISYGYKTVSKTVVSGEENAITLSPAVQLPTKRARYAVAIITAYLSVDPNGTSLAGVSDNAKIEIDIDGGSIDTFVPVFSSGYFRASPKTTFQFRFSPSLYPSTVTASVYLLNAPVGSIVSCSFHIALLGNDTVF